MASPTFPLLAALPDHPGLRDSLGFQLNGLIVVFLALGLIWLLLECTGAWFRRVEAASGQPAVPPAPTVNPPAAASSPELVAAITAAVHVTLGERVRIEAIVPVAGNASWAHEGRQQIFSSHQPR